MSIRAPGPSNMLQLTRSGLEPGADLEALSGKFAESHAIHLPGLLHPDLMTTIWRETDKGTWTGIEHVEIGRELLLERGVAFAVLHFVVNSPEFIQTVKLITRCSSISIFEGRVYRKMPQADHYDCWHSDAVEDAANEPRLAGMSINLGSVPYAGGVFQLRKKGTERPLCELPNIGAGDAILFRISSTLEHRITPIKGLVPKTAFAGWFKPASKDFFSRVHKHPRA